MSLSSAFPSKTKTYNAKTPMILVICNNCKLTQLLHNYDLNDLYNDEYGYRSGINKIMVNHLTEITTQVKKIVSFKT